MLGKAMTALMQLRSISSEAADVRRSLAILNVSCLIVSWVTSVIVTSAVHCESWTVACEMVRGVAIGGTPSAVGAEANGMRAKRDIVYVVPWPLGRTSFSEKSYMTSSVRVSGSRSSAKYRVTSALKEGAKTVVAKTLISYVVLATDPLSLLPVCT